MDTKKFSPVASINLAFCTPFGFNADRMNAENSVAATWTPQDVQDYLNQPLLSGGRPVPGTQGMTIGQIEDDILRGGRFRVFMWNFSIIVMSFQRGSAVRYYRSGESCGLAAWGYTLLSILIGPWGIPWGIFFTFHTIYKNCLGGKDVTSEVLAGILGPQRAHSVMTKAEAPRTDMVLWLLRIVILALPAGLIVRALLADHLR